MRQGRERSGGTAQGQRADARHAPGAATATVEAPGPRAAKEGARVRGGEVGEERFDERSRQTNLPVMLSVKQGEL